MKILFILFYIFPYSSLLFILFYIFPYSSLLFILFYISPCSSLAQPLPLMPPIRNYPPKEYGAGSQVWCIAQDKRGLLYFGAGGCVLEYDGKTWRQIPVKAGATVVSLSYDSRLDRIYVGTGGDFGYISRKSEVGSRKSQEAGLDSLKALSGLSMSHSQSVGDSGLSMSHSQSVGDSGLSLSHSQSVGDLNLPAGSLRYISLLPLVPENKTKNPQGNGEFIDENRNFQNVWQTQVLPSGNGEVFFNAYSHLFFYDGKEIEVFIPEMFYDSAIAGKVHKKRFFISFLVNDTFYIQHTVTGMLKYKPLPAKNKDKGRGSQKTSEATRFITMPGTAEFIQQSGIYAFLANDSFNQNFFIATKREGLFSLQTGMGKVSVKPIIPEPGLWDGYSQDCQPYQGIRLKSGELLIGTLYQGIYSFTPQPAGGIKLFSHINREKGLYDNMVLYLFSEENRVETAQAVQNLWAGLNNGISRISYPSPLSYYDHKTGIEGGIESILQYNARLWLATSQGVYYSARADEYSRQHAGEMKNEGVATNLFSRIKGIDQQCFDMLIKQGSGKAEGKVILVATGNGGVYEVAERNKVPRTEGQGEIVFKQVAKHQAICLSRGEDRDGVFYYGGLNGIYKMELKESFAEKKIAPEWEEQQVITEKEIRDIVTLTVVPHRSKSNSLRGKNNEKPATESEKETLTELWVGTRYEGLHMLLLNGDGKVVAREQYGSNDGLPEGVIQTFSCTNPDGEKGMVIATDKGLYEVRKMEDGRGKWEEGRGKREEGSWK